MKNFKFSKDNRLLLGLLLGSIVLLLIFVSVATFSGAWPGSDVSAQILSALAGAVVTAIITLFLLLGQSANEEKKDKNIKIYQMKMEEYSKFISEMWKLLSDDDKLDDSEMRVLRSHVFNKLIFLLKKDDIETLTKYIADLQAKVENESQPYIIAKILSDITELLRKDLSLSKTEDQTDMRRLWEVFTKDIEKEKIVPQEASLETAPAIESIDTNRQYWHMNMVDRSIQQTALKEGKYELSLIEYEEDGKRTQLLKQVQQGDLIFLYNKGNMFLGIFEAVGRRIFFYDGETLKEEYVADLNHKDQPIITNDKLKIEEDVKTYDIYGGIKDDAYFCSNLIVKPLACMLMPKDEDVAAYRPTICRYWKDYGDSILNKYKEALDSSNPNFGKIDDAVINCDTETFKSLFK